MIDQNTSSTNKTKDGPQIVMKEFDGNTIYARRVNPYGFLYLSLEQGELPIKYQGAYTGLDQASLAIDHYIDDYRREASSGKEVVTHRISKKKALSA